MSAISMGLQGVLNAQSNLQQAGQQIAKANTDSDTLQPDKLTLSLLDLNTSKIQAQANTKVITTSNEVLGSIIDLKV